MQSAVKGVVLDFGGVMTTTTMPERVRPIVESFGLSWQAVADGFRRYRRLSDGGFFSLETMYSLIWADEDVDVPAEAMERIIAADTASFLCRNERTLEWMRSLKSEGFRLGILTNMPPSFAVEFRRTFDDFIALADAVVISGEEGVFKPQRRIYDLLQGRIGLPAESLLFVDDSEENCEGARRAGWRALRFESNAQAEAAFRILAAGGGSL